MELDAVTVAKESDPVSWDLAKSEWIDQEMGDEQILEIGSLYYRASDIEDFLAQELGE